MNRLERALEWQFGGQYHPLTCPEHPDLRLVPLPNPDNGGIQWLCPHERCAYVQTYDPLDCMGYYGEGEA